MGNAQKEVIRHIASGEVGRSDKKVNWKRFIHLSSVWIVSMMILFAVSSFLEVIKESKNLFSDVILRVDTLSLMFSLVLSIILDRLWDERNYGQKGILIIQLVIFIVGFLCYLAYSFIEITNPQNIYFQSESRLPVHTSYIILSTVVAIIGFLIDSKE